jgi:5'-nucleotidase
VAVILIPFLVALVAAGAETKKDGSPKPESGTASVRLLGLSDFHGHLESPRSIVGRKVGGAGYLAAYLNRYGSSGNTVRVHAGDMIGASPMISGYFHDEPAVRAMNEMEFDVGTVGNHEFDEGVEEIKRLIHGGGREDGRQFQSGRATSQSDFPGAEFPFLGANTVWADSGEPVLQPYQILERNGVRIGFIGVTTPATAEIVRPRSISALRFLDISDTVNRYTAELRRAGVETIVVLAHSGGVQPGPGEAEGEIVSETAQMDEAVDVVIGGHTHTRLNTRVGGKLLVEAGKYGMAFSVVDLEVDRLSGEVLGSQAKLITTYNDELQPDRELKGMVDRYRAEVEPVSERVIGTSAGEISDFQTEFGESAIGYLVADAQRSFAVTDFAFVPTGRLRAGIPPGPITYGDLYEAQPFRDRLVSMQLSGRQVEVLLEQQHTRQRTRTLQVSGLSYVYDPSGPFGRRVTDVKLPDGSPIELKKTYTVVVNDFLSAGGGGFEVLKAGRNRRDLGENLRALEAYIRDLPQFSPPSPVTEPRVTLYAE